jgi:hypothetical protein
MNGVPKSGDHVDEQWMLWVKLSIPDDSVFRRGGPAMIGKGSHYPNSTKSMAWRGPSDADGGHFLISIHMVRRP